MTMISEHFSWEEVTRSPTAVQKGIDNSLPEELRENALRLAERMEAVRSVLGVPIHVNSWYRSPALNAAIGGSKTSAHMLALAQDFRAPKLRLSVAFELIAKSDIAFDQLIHESTRDGADWIHFGLAPAGKLERHDVMRAGGVALGGPMQFSRIAVG